MGLTINRLFTLSLAFLSLGCLPLSTYAAIPWRTERYTHFSQGEDLRGLLRSFVAAQGVNGVINESINATVSGNFEGMSPQTFFDGMVSANSLVWFYDGTNLYIDPASEVRTQALQLPYVSADKLIEAAKEIHYEASSWSVSRVAQAGIVQISGPALFVNKLTELAMALNTGLTEKDSIRVFPLKYAWAQDTNIAYQGQSVTVPGVAAQLQQLMFGQSGPSSSGSATTIGGTLSTPKPVNSQMTSMTALGGLPLNNTPPSSTATNSPDNAKNPPAAQGNPSSNASIQANVQLNALVIRDSLGRMALYEDAIALLDRPVPIIEITVSIVDVNTQYTRELGNRLFQISKTGGSNTFDIGIGPSGGDGKSSSTSSTPANIGLSAGFSGTVSAYKFVEAIRALEADNHAQTLSRPSVLTLDNTEAVIDRQQTFYVPISSQYAASLFNVNSGTVLRVTPHLIEDKGHRKVKLLVNIQDGSIDFTVPVNGMPTVSQSSVTTQAVVQEGQGLLIAGQYNKSDQKGDSGLPFINQIPLIGLLFGTKSKSQTTAERMYLITPKLIDLDEIPQEPYKQFFQSPLETEKALFKRVPDSYSVFDSEDNQALVHPDNARNHS